MRVFIHCDNSFRKPKLISCKLAFLNCDIEEEDPRKLNRINYLYGYTYKKINNEVNQFNARLQRHKPDDIANCLSFVDCVILFHNFIEYNNGMDSIIDTCIKYNIPLIIYTDHIKNQFLTNLNGELIITSQFPCIERLNNKVVMDNFNYEEYKFCSNTDFTKIIKLLQQTYEELENERVEKSIKLT